MINIVDVAGGRRLLHVRDGGAPLRCHIYMYIYILCVCVSVSVSVCVYIDR